MTDAVVLRAYPDVDHMALPAWRPPGGSERRCPARPVDVLATSVPDVRRLALAHDDKGDR